MSLLPILLLFFGYFAANHALKIEFFNSFGKGSTGLPVTSSIIIGKNEAILIDAQMERKYAKALIEKIKATGKQLTTIYISHFDPDFYFGLDLVHKAFPNAKILSTQQSIEMIKKQKDDKLAFWKKCLPDGEPEVIPIPEPLKGDKIL